MFENWVVLVAEKVSSTNSSFISFKRQSHKMVKHTQTIRVLPTNCLSVFDHFVGMAVKGLITKGNWVMFESTGERDSE